MKLPVFPTFLALVVVAIAIGTGFAYKAAVNTPTSPTPNPLRSSSDGLAGLLTGTSPWTSNSQDLAVRLHDLNLPALSAEGTALHIHQHLDLVINGQPVTVPSHIGIPNPATFISPIHTHDDSGIIHVESPTIQDFYLGQVFDVWGLRLSATCIGGYCASGDQSLSVYVNGSKLSSDPRQLKLEAHQEIALIFGSAAQMPAQVPSSYAFPSGY